MAFSPAGDLLASASVDGTAKLWPQKTGHCQTTLRPRAPYANLNITGATGISEAQRTALLALGAGEER
ncbi:MAG: hypothetical protein KF832_09325 [Caldilineaceae bacterium]|nr:hypothetical protein [Caldilineaceae bacterium]